MLELIGNIVGLLGKFLDAQQLKRLRVHSDEMLRLQTELDREYARAYNDRDFFQIAFLKKSLKNVEEAFNRDVQLMTKATPQ